MKMHGGQVLHAFSCSIFRGGSTKPCVNSTKQSLSSTKAAGISTNPFLTSTKPNFISTKLRGISTNLPVQELKKLGRQGERIKLKFRSLKEDTRIV